MMEEAVISTSTSDSNDELPKERMTPLGANSSENELNFNETIRFKALEEEQEELNSSLMSLTTHFAQVQFRLRQIVNAPNDMKEELLKELEQFASRGCPDLNKKNYSIGTISHDQIIEEQRNKQKHLIEELKTQLKDLESYAYQTGNLEIPSTIVAEKQKVIIDELKEKIHLPLDNLNKLTNEDLKKAVEQAIGQIVNPVKVKEQLVNQLKTQIADLERFINFLQGEANSPGPYGKTQCTCPVHDSSFIFPSTSSSMSSIDKNNNHNKCKLPSSSNNSKNKSSYLIDSENSKQYHNTLDMLKKMLTIVQMFTITQLSCGVKSFEKNTLKKTASGNHWGDLRAKLEISINKVLETDKECELRNHAVDTDSDDDDDHKKNRNSAHELIHVIRKDLSVALRDLFQHGLTQTTQSNSLVPAFTCFPIRSREVEQQLHIWDLFLKYYEIKHGKEFTDSPARTLSQSFNLNVVGGKAITVKQSLLSTIQTVINIHKQYKNNKDSHFKTFVCIALNEKKLVVYLKQLLKTSILIENYYQSWSYVKSTGFDDALKSLDQLKIINFNLPTDRSVKNLTKIKDLF